mmetsp:Transcript_28247/g.28623  ORF Transcript_28247/g.28623 Transcript_28247/m.28623 type:complete len:83 (+) Transcript_28247:359-607(+)
MGRASAFFCHPVERGPDDMRAGVTVPPDFMTRQLINKTSGDLNLRDLGQAKNSYKRKFFQECSMTFLCFQSTECRSILVGNL